MSESNRQSQFIRLVITDGTGEIFSKTFESTTITFGRSPKTDIPLEFDFVSRTHGSFNLENGTWYLTDLKSSNGTFVNGQKISKIPVHDGLQVQVGKLVFSIQLSDTKTASVDPDDEVTSPTIVANGGPPPKTVPQSYTATVPIQSPQRITQPAPQVAHPIPLVHGNAAVAQAPRVSPPPPLPSPTPVAAPVVVNAPVHPPLHVVKPPEPTQVVSQEERKGVRVPVLDRDFSKDMFGIHPGAAATPRRKLEAVVTWHGQVYDVREFENGQTVTAGPAGRSSLKVPILKDPMLVAKVGHDRAQCVVPKGGQISVGRANQNLAMNDLLAAKFLQQTDFGYSLKIDFQDVAHIDFGAGMEVHFRYVPASPPLPNWRGNESESAFQQSILSSFVLHGVLLLIIMLTAPPEVHGPKLKNVPERFARLLVEKPKPKPTPAPTPKPQEKKVVVKPPEPKKPEKVVIHKPPKVIQKVNKFPIVVQHPVPKAPPPVKVQDLGALAALGPLSNNLTPVVTNININKNAGGIQTKAINTGGVIGALPSTNGMLAAGGGPRVKTKGMGYGTGTGYGVQGLKGNAGGRAVAGAVVGEPKLAKSAKIEGLTRAQVMAVIQKYLGEVQHCYERILLSNPNLAGRMEFEWDIASGGDVTGVRVKRSTVNGGDSLGECVKGIFAGMKFPHASNGQTTTPSIGFPFGRL